MADPLDFEKPWRLNSVAADVVGNDVQILHIHIAVRPQPTIHIGYAIGDRAADGTFTAKRVKTVALGVAEVKTANPGEFPARAAILKTLMNVGYALLTETGKIGNGQRA